MAHPKIQRSLFTAGVATAMLALPLSGPAFALAGLEDTLAPVAETVDQTLPAPVADAVDKAAAPVKEAIQEQAKPVVDQVLESLPAPVQEAAAKVTPSGPAAGPVSTAPVAPAGPRGGDAPSVVEAPGPMQAAAPAPSSNDAAYYRARQALLSQPMTTSPFPALSELLSTDAPMTAGREGATSTSAVPSTTAAGWLVATATGLLVALGAAHVAYADGRLSKQTTTA